MTVLMFFFLFPALVTDTIADGRFNRGAYEIMGTFASLLILVSILVSAIGTRSRIKYLKTAPPRRRITLKLVFRDIFETLANRSFLAPFRCCLAGCSCNGFGRLAQLLLLHLFLGVLIDRDRLADDGCLHLCDHRCRSCSLCDEKNW